MIWQFLCAFLTSCSKTGRLSLSQCLGYASEYWKPHVFADSADLLTMHPDPLGQDFL